MRTVSIFKNGSNQSIRIPKDLEFEGVAELEVIKEGNTLILRPVRPSWESYFALPKFDEDFLGNREDRIEDRDIFGELE